MTSPGCTLTGTLTDISGNGIAGTASMLLCNFGNNPPFVSGSNLLTQLSATASAASNGEFSIAFYGNYQISPSGTFYQISWQIPGLSAFNDSSILAAYVFLTAGTYDLSTLIPLTAPSPQGTLALAPQYAEVPAGAINSSNATFTLHYSPLPSASLNVFVNGLRQTLGTAYTLSGSTITFLGGYIPRTNSSLVCNYTYLR